MRKATARDKLILMNELSFGDVSLNLKDDPCNPFDPNRILYINPLILDICRTIRRKKVEDIQRKCFHKGCKECSKMFIKSENLAKAFGIRTNKALYCMNHGKEMIEMINKEWGDQNLIIFSDKTYLKIQLNNCECN